MGAGQPAPRPSGGQLLAPIQAQTARRQADMARAHALMGVATGRTTIWDVLGEASMPGGQALLRLSLRQLLLAQPNVGTLTVRNRLESLNITRGYPMVRTTRAMTIQWLLDPRASGHRMLAFVDAADTPRGRSPWPGFPFAPPAAAERPVVLGAST
jgi:hypothetical protein